MKNLKNVGLIMLLASSFVGCKRTAATQDVQANGATGSAGGGAIELAAMALTADTTAGSGFCIPASLAADGALTVEGNVAARFSGNRLLTTDGTEVFHVEGSQVVVPWNTTKNMTIAADGSLAGTRDQFAIGDNGVPTMQGANAGCRITGFAPAQRRLATLLFVSPMMLMAHAMFLRQADGGAPSGPTAPPGVAQFRLINALGAHNGTTLTFKWQGVETPAFADVAFGTRTQSYASQTGSRLYEVFPSGHLDEASRIMNGSTTELEANKNYLAIVYATDNDAHPAIVVEEEVAPTAPGATDSLVSFFNAWSGPPRVQLCFGTAGSSFSTPVMEAAVEGSWGVPVGTRADGKYLPLETASLARFQLRAQNDTACRGAVLGTFAVPDFSPTRTYTLVALGHQRGTPAGKVLVCPSDLGACRLVPIGR